MDKLNFTKEEVKKHKYEREIGMATIFDLMVLDWLILHTEVEAQNKRLEEAEKIIEMAKDITERNEYAQDDDGSYYCSICGMKKGSRHNSFCRVGYVLLLIGQYREGEKK
jgi:hypothetical protein